MKRKMILLLLCLAVVLIGAMVGIVFYENKHVRITPYTLTCARLPKAFEGFTIAHISDLHNDELGKGNAGLLSLLRSARPDLIVFTGDIIDSYTTDPDVAVDLAAQAASIAPVCYALGNHELRKDEAFLQDYLTRMEQAGVTVLRDQSIQIEKNGSFIHITGLEAALSPAPADAFSLLLAHHPERLEDYAAAGYDLTLSGHAHGGQFRIPFVGGLFAPGQGFFPRYTAGLHAQGGTQMVISRGIGGVAFPPRLNNSPEIPLLTLRCK